MQLVLDTNIILLDAYNLTNIASSGGYTSVVLPETVIDEADSKKSGHSELAFQARQFARLLAKATRISSTTDGILTTTVLDLNDTRIHVVSCSRYPHFSDDETSIRNDRKILHVAELLHRRTSDVVFCSNDVMCRLRAESLGLQTIDHKLVDDTELMFTAHITSTLTAPIIIPELPPECKNLCITDSVTGQTGLVTLYNKTPKLILREEEDDIRKQMFPPVNSGQLFLSSAILDRSVDIVICEAMSGSGKTVTAISNAMKLVSTNSPYNSIIYIRNTVDDIGEKDEEIGFLSGNDEKVKGYLYPFYDTIESMVRSKLKNTKLKGQELEAKVLEGVEEMISKYNMKAMTAMHMRGRTFTDAVIIVDEAQNFSKSTMQKLLTRIGKNTKVIVIGSLRQIDSKYLNKYTSGLSVLLDACTAPTSTINIVGVSLERVVRGPITEWAERLFTKQSK